MTRPRGELTTYHARAGHVPTIFLKAAYIQNRNIVFFKRLGSRHIHKECMNGIDYIICKTDLSPIRRLAYNTFNDVHFEARFKSLCAFVVFTISIKAGFERGGFRYCNDLDINWIVSEFNKLSLFFWAQIPRRLWQPQRWTTGFFHYKVSLTFYIHETHQENVAQKSGKNSHQWRMLLSCNFHNVCEKKILID